MADTCPNGCLYCFEHKKVENGFDPYNKHAMRNSLDTLLFNMGQKKLSCNCQSSNESNHITLHGGEVFALPVDDFEYFIQSISEYNRGPSIQSSLGVPITNEHVRLLKKYNVNVGVSIDGPRELNILRGPRDPDQNKKFQDTVYSNLEILKNNKIGGGILTVLSKANATGDNISKLIEWGIQMRRGGRFNPMFPPFFSDGELAKYVLTPSELKYAFLKLYDAYLTRSDFMFSLAKEMTSFLLGKRDIVCSLAGCDYITTSCSAVLPDGGISRCDRTFQDGYYYIGQQSTDVRAKMLEQTECFGCKYFQVCRGGCPAEGKDRDFRSKTIFCEAIYALYEKIENNLRKTNPGIVLSIDIENYFDDYFKIGKRFNPYMRDNFFDQTTHGRGVKDIRFRSDDSPDKDKDKSKKSNEKDCGSGYRHLDGWR